MLNSIILMGRLTADVELKTAQNGASVTSFDIAVDRDYSGQDGEKQTDFFTCVAWRSTAEFISRNFFKGKMIAVAGKLQARRYTDKDGNNRVAVEIKVNNAYFADGKTAGANDNASNKQKPPFIIPSEETTPSGYTFNYAEDFTEDFTDDGDLPF